MTTTYVIEIDGRRVPVVFASAERASTVETELRKRGADVEVVAVFEEDDDA